MRCGIFPACMRSPPSSSATDGEMWRAAWGSFPCWSERGASCTGRKPTTSCISNPRYGYGGHLKSLARPLSSWARCWQPGWTCFHLAGLPNSRSCKAKSHPCRSRICYLNWSMHWALRRWIFSWKCRRPRSPRLPSLKYIRPN
jgi:hypothetical protein